MHASSLRLTQESCYSCRACSRSTFVLPKSRHYKFPGGAASSGHWGSSTPGGARVKEETPIVVCQ